MIYKWNDNVSISNDISNEVIINVCDVKWNKVVMKMKWK
jgi:hypothetical protein